VILPAIARAVTSSGPATKECVAGLPSFLLAKLRLYDVIIVFFSPGSIPCRFHCPIQGPQALASTFPPIFVNTSSCPSLSIVALICSDPGVITNSDLAFNPLDAASFAMFADLSISS